MGIIIVVSGRGNTGKTKSIIKADNLLTQTLEKLDKNISIKVIIRNKFKNDEDFWAVIEITIKIKVILVISTAGDTPQYLQAAFNRFKKYNGNILIIAAKNGATLEKLKELGRPHTIINIEKHKAVPNTTTPNQNKENATTAQEIIEHLIQVIKKLNSI